jgi:hypothetical protein
MTIDQPQHRTLATIDLDLLMMTIGNGEGGYYNAVTGDVLTIMDGDVITGEDEEFDLEDAAWIGIGAEDSRDKYRDMSDFADAVTDPVIADRLARALTGAGAFRRFKNTVQEAEPRLDLIWHRFADARAESRAIDWLVDDDLCDEIEAALAVQERADQAERALGEAARWVWDRS